MMFDMYYHDVILFYRLTSLKVFPIFMQFPLPPLVRLTVLPVSYMKTTSTAPLCDLSSYWLFSNTHWQNHTHTGSGMKVGGA